MSCTEAWLRLGIPSAPLFREVELLRDGEILARLQLRSSDTLLVDEALQPNHTYTYQIRRRTALDLTDESETITVTTLDTTSHEFSWTVYLLGGHSSSFLTDVTFLEDTVAYAAGAVYLNSSSGVVDPTAYNLVKWGGSTPIPMRIGFFGICGQPDYAFYRSSSVASFSPTDMWVAMYGDQVARWNGSAQTTRMCLPVDFLVTSLFPARDGVLFAVGNRGTVLQTRDQGNTWLQINTGTFVPINDVWGGRLSTDASHDILLAATDKYAPGDRRLLRVSPSGEVSSLPLPSQAYEPYSVWYDRHWPIYAAGSSVVTSRDGVLWKSVTTLPPTFTNKIRGNGNNDIIVVGDFGLVAHFNGISWSRYNSLASSARAFHSVCVRGD